MENYSYLLYRKSHHNEQNIKSLLAFRKSPSSFVLLVCADRNVKAFIVPISDYIKKKENKNEKKIDKKYVAWDIVTDRFMIDQKKTMGW